jgi:hypothetical protein
LLPSELIPNSTQELGLALVRQLVLVLLQVLVLALELSLLRM